MTPSTSMAPIDGVVFCGQGSQRQGMGLDLLDRPIARRQYELASDVLGFDVADVCRGADGRLDLTEFTQPSILTMEWALFEILRSERADFAPVWFAGHSLGEYTALVAAGVMPFETALRLVRLRGQIMQRCVPAGFGRMLAVVCENMGESVTAEVPSFCEAAGVDIASVNSPCQCVVSGLNACVDTFVALLEPRVASGAVRLVPLPTSAPFHSRAMREGSLEFAAALHAVSGEFRAERATHVFSNASGRAHTGTLDGLCDGLASQFDHTVRWLANMDALAAVSHRIVELGPDRPLRSFFKARGIDISSVMDARSLARLPVAGVH